MKGSLPALVLVAVASSLATVATTELLRGSDPEPQAALAGKSAGTPGAASWEATPGRLEGPREGRPPSSLEEPAGGPSEMGLRLQALERRLADLERRAEGAAVPATELPAPDSLRVVVLDWLSAEREAWAEEEQARQERKRRAQREFDARYRAYMLKRRHDLEDWEEERLIAIFVETARRTAAIEDSVDPATDDPEEVERRWEEFDEWVERYEREQMGPELWSKLAQDG